MTNKEILVRLMAVLKPHRTKLVVAMVAMIAVGGFNALQAYLVKPLLDEIFFKQDAHLLNLLPLALLLVFFIKGFFYFLYSYFLELVGQCVIRDLRTMVYAHVMEQPLSFFHKTSTGELISRIINDVSIVQGSVSYTLIRSLRDFCSVFGLLGVIFYMDWRLALISLVFLPMAGVPLVVFGRKFRKISTNYQERLGEATSQLHETIAGVSIVKAFCMEPFEKKRFAGRMQHIMNILLSETWYNSLSHPCIEMLAGVGMAVIIWFGGSQVLDGHSTPGAFMAFFTALLMLYEPIKGVSKVNSNIQQGVAAAHRIFTLLDVRPDISEAPDATAMPPFSQHIEFAGVTFGYEPATPVLKQLSFRVNRGEVLAVVGPSGGGKTTLTNLLLRFYDADQGRLLIDGADIRGYTLASLRHQIAVVTQQTVLFNDTVRNNIAYGSGDCSQEALLAAARAANALDFITALPQGFDTVIGESGARLSGGQRQRLSIARALLKDAPILILDEATSALDNESEREVQQALENLMHNRTTIVIAHRLSTIQNADRIIVLKDGQMAEEGKHGELLALGGEYSYLYHLQFSGDAEKERP
ncbi:MAG: lipid A export permease/ATP-binding protein MsbA [Desulfobulbus sp.]|jgi:subfamily B ATP-binding cassette protein MsbA|uniref:lipid A export permease/ATP-binding protein MsbA n=1 Tax=Desulfobulbus sp. TaxID=895 RepID=UPI00284DA2E8|nr:lipid A export permease/ATP-binding protein MsbA [Desulfobulbus sp.]MDR2548875.1 lipid A export permease/ATP-binding protein MsbA [Desulfobulbus sp.]